MASRPVGVGDVVTAVLAQLKPGKEYPYSKVLLNLGFKRVGERLPELSILNHISYGVAGTLLNSDAIYYAMGSLELGGMAENVFRGIDPYIRFTPALHAYAKTYLFGKLKRAGVSQAALKRAAVIVEEALMLAKEAKGGRILVTEEMLNSSRSRT